MRATRNQNTINAPFSVSGRGFWTGEVNTLTFQPAAPGTGIVFVRDDLLGKPRVAALAEHRVSMGLRTRLSAGAAVFDMIEHVMAAVYGANIDNVEIHCTECEMPSFDGSCMPLTLALQAVGLREQQETVQQVVIDQVLQAGDEESFVLVEPADQLEVEYRLDYGQDSPVGVSTFASPITSEIFSEQIAAARTFVTEQEASLLQSKGLGTHVTTRDLLVFGAEGPIDNQLRFDDECARHKALDVVGDLALVGADLVGRIVAYRSGHKLNGELAAMIRKKYLSEESGNGRYAA